MECIQCNWKDPNRIGNNVSRKKTSKHEFYVGNITDRIWEQVKDIELGVELGARILESGFPKLICML